MDKFDKDKYVTQWKADNKDKVAKHNAAAYEKKQEYLAEDIQCDMCNKTIKRSSYGKHKKCCQQYIDTNDWSMTAMLSLRKEYQKPDGVNNGGNKK